VSARVAIVDYGMGNLHSVANAVSHVGGEPAIVGEADALETFEKIILPGVGAFGDAMRRLDASGLSAELSRLASAGRPILGICLGMQLMCSSSEEGGINRGLGWFEADVRAFPAHLGVKVPHIGWNDLHFARPDRLLDGLGGTPDLYFVHGYRVECRDEADVLAWCDYGEPFAAMIARGRLCGMQFHPEKSQHAGLAMLKSFIEGSGC
jgi:glutamine amidotransferase